MTAGAIATTWLGVMLGGFIIVVRLSLRPPKVKVAEERRRRLWREGVERLCSRHACGRQEWGRDLALLDNKNCMECKKDALLDGSWL